MTLLSLTKIGTTCLIRLGRQTFDPCYCTLHIISRVLIFAILANGLLVLWTFSRHLYQQNVQDYKIAKKSTCENMSPCAHYMQSYSGEFFYGGNFRIVEHHTKIKTPKISLHNVTLFSITSFVPCDLTLCSCTITLLAKVKLTSQLQGTIYARYTQCPSCTNNYLKYEIFKSSAGIQLQ